jgi:hypothetical protein
MSKSDNENPQRALKREPISLLRAPDPSVQAFKRRLDEYLAEAVKLAEVISRRAADGKARD